MTYQKQRKIPQSTIVSSMSYKIQALICNIWKLNCIYFKISKTFMFAWKYASKFVYAKIAWLEIKIKILVNVFGPMKKSLICTIRGINCNYFKIFKTLICAWNNASKFVYTKIAWLEIKIKILVNVFGPMKASLICTIRGINCNYFKISKTLICAWKYASKFVYINIDGLQIKV